MRDVAVDEDGAPALAGKVCILDVATGRWESRTFGSKPVSLEDCEPTAVGVFDPGTRRCYNRVTAEVPALKVFEALAERLDADAEKAEERLMWLRRIMVELDEEEETE